MGLGAMNVIGVIGFLIGIVGIGMAVWSRGESAGRTHSAIDDSKRMQETIVRILHEESATMKTYSAGIAELGGALKEVASTMRDFTARQAETNGELWNAIAVIADQNKRALERRREEGKEPA